MPPLIASVTRANSTATAPSTRRRTFWSPRAATAAGYPLPPRWPDADLVAMVCRCRCGRVPGDLVAVRAVDAADGDPRYRVRATGTGGPHRGSSWAVLAAPPPAGLRSPLSPSGRLTCPPRPPTAIAESLVCAAGLDGRLLGPPIPHRRQVNGVRPLYRVGSTGPGSDGVRSPARATYIMSAGVYLVIVLAALTGDPRSALVVCVTFGAVRGSMVLDRHGSLPLNGWPGCTSASEAWRAAGASDPSSASLVHGRGSGCRRRWAVRSSWRSRAAVTTAVGRHGDRRGCARQPARCLLDRRHGPGLSSDRGDGAARRDRVVAVHRRVAAFDHRGQPCGSVASATPTDSLTSTTASPTTTGPSTADRNPGGELSSPRPDAWTGDDELVTAEAGRRRRLRTDPTAGPPPSRGRRHRRRGRDGRWIFEAVQVGERTTRPGGRHPPAS